MRTCKLQNRKIPDLHTRVHHVRRLREMCAGALRALGAARRGTCAPPRPAPRPPIITRDARLARGARDPRRSVGPDALTLTRVRWWADPISPSRTRWVHAPAPTPPNCKINSCNVQRCSSTISRRVLASFRVSFCGFRARARRPQVGTPDRPFGRFAFGRPHHRLSVQATRPCVARRCPECPCL